MNHKKIYYFNILIFAFLFLALIGISASYDLKKAKSARAFTLPSWITNPIVTVAHPDGNRYYIKAFNDPITSQRIADAYNTFRASLPTNPNLSTLERELINRQIEQHIGISGILGSGPGEILPSINSHISAMPTNPVPQSWGQLYSMVIPALLDLATSEPPREGRVNTISDCAGGVNCQYYNALLGVMSNSPAGAVITYTADMALQMSGGSEKHAVEIRNNMLTTRDMADRIASYANATNGLNDFNAYMNVIDQHFDVLKPGKSGFLSFDLVDKVRAIEKVDTTHELRNAMRDRLQQVIDTIVSNAGRGLGDSEVIKPNDPLSGVHYVDAEKKIASKKFIECERYDPGLVGAGTVQYSVSEKWSTYYIHSKPVKIRSCELLFMTPEEYVARFYFDNLDYASVLRLLSDNTTSNYTLASLKNSPVSPNTSRYYSNDVYRFPSDVPGESSVYMSPDNLGALLNTYNAIKSGAGPQNPVYKFTVVERIVCVKDCEDQLPDLDPVYILPPKTATIPPSGDAAYKIEKTVSQRIVSNVVSEYVEVDTLTLDPIPPIQDFLDNLPPILSRGNVNVVGSGDESTIILNGAKIPVTVTFSRKAGSNKITLSSKSFERPVDHNNLVNLIRNCSNGVLAPDQCVIDDPKIYVDPSFGVVNIGYGKPDPTSVSYAPPVLITNVDYTTPTDPTSGGGTTTPTDPTSGGGTTTPTDPTSGGGTTTPTDPTSGGGTTTPNGGSTTSPIDPIGKYTCPVNYFYNGVDCVNPYDPTQSVLKPTPLLSKDIPVGYECPNNWLFGASGVNLNKCYDPKNPLSPPVYPKKVVTSDLTCPVGYIKNSQSKCIDPLQPDLPSIDPCKCPSCSVDAPSNNYDPLQPDKTDSQGNPCNDCDNAKTIIDNLKKLNESDTKEKSYDKDDNGLNDNLESLFKKQCTFENTKDKPCFVSLVDFLVLDDVSITDKVNATYTAVRNDFKRDILNIPVADLSEDLGVYKHVELPLIMTFSPLNANLACRNPDFSFSVLGFYFPGTIPVCETVSPYLKASMSLFLLFWAFISTFRFYRDISLMIRGGA